MTSIEELWNSLKKTFPTPTTAQQQRLEIAVSLPSTTTAYQVDQESAQGSFQLQTSSGIESVSKKRLRQRFLDLCIGGRTSSTSFLVPTVLASCAAETNDAPNDVSTVAIDTLSLGVIATYAGDEHLSQTATTLHAQASIALRQRLHISKSRALTTHELEDSLIAICSLGVCTYLDCIDTKDSTWLHCNNLFIDILQQQRWPLISTTLQTKWAERALYAGFVTRRRISSMTAKIPTQSNESTFFETHAALIPELLEDTNRLSSTDAIPFPSRIKVYQHLTKLGQAATSIKRAQFQWSANMPFRFRMANIKSFNDLHLYVANQPAPFELAYRFSRPRYEAEFQASAISMLKLSQAILSIYGAYPDLYTDPELQLQLEMARQDAKSAADSMCMLVPRYLEPDNGALNIIMAVTLLDFASRFYRRYEYEELQWCRTVMDAVKNRFGISVKSTHE